MALPDLTGQNIQDTYKRVLTVGDGGLMYDGTGSLFTPLSASHEITTEVSSSHAVTADTLSGLTSTVTELNYLDGVLSTVANAYDSFATQSQGVIRFYELDNGYDDLSLTSLDPSGVPTFLQLSLTGISSNTPTIRLPIEASQEQLHISVMSELEADTPGIFFGDTGGDIITFVDQNAQAVASIDQNGLFSGTASNATNISATTNTENESQFVAFLDNNNSTAQQICYDDGIKYNPSLNNLSVAGEISSSGGLVAPRLDFTSLGDSGAYLKLSSDIVTLKNPEILFTGHITASGNISASGNLIVNEITASGNISASATSTGSFGYGYFTNNLGIGVGSPSHTLEVKGPESTLARFYDSSNGSIGQIEIGTMDIKVDSDTMQFRDSSNNPLVTINTGGHLTASGDISSSGDIYASNLILSADGIIAPSENNETIKFMTKPPGAADNGERLTIGPDLIEFQGGTGTNQYSLLNMDMTDGSETIQFNGSSNNVSFVINTQKNGKLKALGGSGMWVLENHIGISSGSSNKWPTDTYGIAGTPDKQLMVHGTTHLTGSVEIIGPITTHITASGNISSSGDIYANNLWIPEGNKILFDNESDNDQWIKGADNYITIEADNILNINADNDVIITTPNLSTSGHITSSGNISASGNIIAPKFVGQSETIVQHSFYAAPDAYGVTKLINGKNHYGWADRGWAKTFDKSDLDGTGFDVGEYAHHGVPIVYDLTNLQVVASLRPHVAVTSLAFYLYSGSAPAGSTNNETHLGFICSASAATMVAQTFNDIYITGSTGYSIKAGEHLYVFVESSQASSHLKGTYTVKGERV